MPSSRFLSPGPKAQIGPIQPNVFAGSNASNGTSSSTPIASKYSSDLKRMPCWQLSVAAVLIGLGSLLLFGGLVTHTILVPSVVRSSIEEVGLATKITSEHPIPILQNPDFLKTRKFLT